MIERIPHPKTLKIIGGNPLRGEVTPIPNKNAIVAALPACVLTNQTVIYKNLPKTTDVLKLLGILKKLGAKVHDSDFSNIAINCSNIKTYEVDREQGNAIRASILFAGPLLARLGKAKIPLPGGCVLGRRSISAHIDAFAKVGVKTEIKNGFAHFTKSNLKNTEFNIWMMEASVTATENLCMYCAGTNGTFNITEAACEPHICQLLTMLSKMGAKIEGIGSNKVYIKGRKSLLGTEFVPEPDFVDIGGLIVATAITKGKIRIKGANISYIVDGIVQCMEKFGIKIEKAGKDLVVDGSGELKIDPINSGFPMYGEDLPKLAPRPWPGFPVDLLPVIVVLACKTKGRILIQNWMYESGLEFTRELTTMGADIFMADPHRIIINGPIKFKGGKITSPSVIQACKAIFLAALADKVETQLTGAEILKRRYPDVISVYKSLGANIEVLP